MRARRRATVATPRLRNAPLRPLLGALLLGGAGCGASSSETTWDTSSAPVPFQCPIQVPAQTWPPSAAIAFAHAGMEDVMLADPPLGADGSSPHSRTLLLQEGHCWEGNLRSKHFRYAGGGDAWMVHLRKGADVSRVDLELAPSAREPRHRPPAHEPVPPDVAPAPSPPADAEASDGGIVPGEAPPGGRRCSLAGFSVHRLGLDDDVFELRLQYEGCRGEGHYPDKAAVALMIEPRGNCSSNLVPWMCELSAQDFAADLSSCSAVPPASPVTLLTTSTSTRSPKPTELPGEVSLSVHAQWRQVGRGRCNSPGLRAAEQVQPMTQEECQQLCFERLASYAVNRDSHDRHRCRGYAFNSGSRAEDRKCILYTSLDVEVTHSDTVSPGDWECWSIYVDDGSMSTEEPRKVAQGGGADAGALGRSSSGSSSVAPGAQSLHLFSLGSHELPTMSVLRRLEPPLQSPNCFDGVDWYTLESSAGTRASICAHEHHWPALRKLVPGPLPAPAAGKAPGRVTMERVCVDICALDGGGCAGERHEALAAEAAQGGAAGKAGLVPLALAAGAAALATAVLACIMVYYDCCGCLTTRHPTKPQYRLIMQEYMPGTAQPFKTRDLFHGEALGDSGMYGWGVQDQW